MDKSRDFTSILEHEKKSLKLKHEWSSQTENRYVEDRPLLHLDEKLEHCRTLYMNISAESYLCTQGQLCYSGLSEMAISRAAKLRPLYKR